MTLIRFADLSPRPWPNGLGTTREVAAGGGWQIGVADLGAEAAFSHFSGQDRIFTLLDGPGGVLVLEGRGDLPCHPLVPAHFPGDVPTLYRPRGGPARAFNVIARRDIAAPRVAVLNLAPGHAAPAPSDVVHCVRGAIALDGHRLDPGDTLLRGAGPPRAVDGAAVLIAVELPSG